MIYYYFSCWLREWILRLVFRVEFVYYTCFCARYNADVKSLWILKWMFKVQSGFRGFGCVTFSTGCGWNRWFVPMILCEYLGLHHTRDVILKILSRYWNFLLCLGGIILVFRLTARIHSTCFVNFVWVRTSTFIIYNAQSKYNSFFFFLNCLLKEDSRKMESGRQWHVWK